eukprot:TRINITY_DN49319_c0_g1_i1.p1 TRINITY_DN49319_c0_g1~~TRINITY_DN49319_c0_g1_i1.p1  ORF type:complete len:710 (+),score=59.44 TRINITY_DN49319_c0_g1_i1:171-2132(+)
MRDIGHCPTLRVYRFVVRDTAEETIFARQLTDLRFPWLKLLDKQHDAADPSGDGYSCSCNCNGQEASSSVDDDLAFCSVQDKHHGTVVEKICLRDFQRRIPVNLGPLPATAPPDKTVFVPILPSTELAKRRTFSQLQVANQTKRKAPTTEQYSPEAKKRKTTKGLDALKLAISRKREHLQQKIDQAQHQQQDNGFATVQHDRDADAVQPQHICWGWARVKRKLDPETGTFCWKLSDQNRRNWISISAADAQRVKTLRRLLFNHDDSRVQHSANGDIVSFATIMSRVRLYDHWSKRAVAKLMFQHRWNWKVVQEEVSGLLHKYSGLLSTEETYREDIGVVLSPEDAVVAEAVLAFHPTKPRLLALQGIFIAAGTKDGAADFVCFHFWRKDGTMEDISLAQSKPTALAFPGNLARLKEKKAKDKQAGAGYDAAQHTRIEALHHVVQNNASKGAPWTTANCVLAIVPDLAVQRVNGAVRILPTKGGSTADISGGLEITRQQQVRPRCYRRRAHHMGALCVRAHPVHLGIPSTITCEDGLRIANQHRRLDKLWSNFQKEMQDETAFDSISKQQSAYSTFQDLTQLAVEQLARHRLNDAERWLDTHLDALFTATTEKDAAMATLQEKIQQCSAARQARFRLARKMETAEGRGGLQVGS